MVEELRPLALPVPPPLPPIPAPHEVVGDLAGTVGDIAGSISENVNPMKAIENVFSKISLRLRTLGGF